MVIGFLSPRKHQNLENCKSADPHSLNSRKHDRIEKYPLKEINHALTDGHLPKTTTTAMPRIII
jgi:hypothetical protein